MTDDAAQLRAQIPASTDPNRLERLAREIERKRANAAQWTDVVVGALAFAHDQAEVEAWKHEHQRYLERLKASYPDLYDRIEAAAKTAGKAARP